MHFLLINSNPAVSRLITLSVEKLGSKIDEVSSFDDFPLESYDVVLVDSELYSELTIDELIASGLSRYFVYISPRGEEKPDNMNTVLEKPFLPTDFIDLVSKIDKEIPNDSDETDEDMSEENSFEEIDDLNLESEDISLENIELDSIDDLELESLDELVEEEKEELEKEDTSEEIEETEKSELEEEDDLEESISLEDTLEDDNNDDYTLDEEMLKSSEEENSAEEEIGENELDSILDSEDINEVKQLLDDNEKEEDLMLDDDLTAALDGVETEEDRDKEEDFPLDELEDLSEGDEDVSELEDEIASMEVDEDLNLEEPSAEEIESLDEDFEDSSFNELEDTLDSLIEESNSVDSTISSIDDIYETDLLKALGGTKECAECEPAEVDSSDVSKEIEEIVGQSVKEALEDSSIKDALKGMKVNISITFEEDN